MSMLKKKPHTQKMYESVCVCECLLLCCSIQSKQCFLTKLYRDEHSISLQKISADESLSIKVWLVGGFGSFVPHHYPTWFEISHVSFVCSACVCVCEHTEKVDAAPGIICSFRM